MSIGLGCILNCFNAIIPTLLSSFWLLCYPYILLHFVLVLRQYVHPYVRMRTNHNVHAQVMDAENSIVSVNILIAL